MLTAYGIINC